jgi:hypothetical protein
VYAEVSRFIAAGCDDAPVTGASDEYREAYKTAIEEAFTGDEEGVEIDVGDGWHGLMGCEVRVAGCA